MPEIPDNPMFNMKPNALMYDRMMEAPGLRRGRPQRQGLLSRGPERPEGRPPPSRGQALAEAMNHRGRALVNVVISQGAARKPQQFRWHS